MKVALCALALLLPAAGAAATAATFRAAPTATCLNARKVLTSSLSLRRVAPPAFKPRPMAAITIGFPFAAGKQALDGGAIAFDRDAATARRQYTALLAYQYASAAQVKGISQKQARAQIRAEITLQANVIVAWNHVPQPASRATVAACLR